MGIFSQDGWLVRILNRIGDLIWLNLLTCFCSIPIFTAGAALSSLYEMTLKMVRLEEGKITSSYFRAFRGNFKQATLIWLIGGGLCTFLCFDIWLLHGTSFSFAKYYNIVLFVLLLLILMFTLFSLVVQARFVNTLKNTIKNGVLFCVAYFVKSILMYFVMLIPVVLLFLSYRALLLIVLIGFSGPAYLTSFYFRSLFAPYEPEEEEEESAWEPK